MTRIREEEEVSQMRQAVNYNSTSLTKLSDVLGMSTHAQKAMF